MKSSFGKNLKITIWGGSHEPAIGVDVEGLPIGTVIDMDELQAFLARRSPGNSPFATRRNEPDIAIPVKGFIDEDGRDISFVTDSVSKKIAVSEPIVSLEIRNTDARSSDYVKLRSIPRPGHADYTARLRYDNSLNMAGGGPFSARMTAPLCIAGGIALQILAKQDINIGAHIFSVSDACDVAFNPINVTSTELNVLKEVAFPVLDESSGEEMQAKILDAKDSLDSVGGIVEVCALGVPGGIGGAMYDGLESALAPIFFGIPAVKGVEFGAGFDATLMKGSENNDSFYYDNGEVKTRTNNHGGILGGITSGMPLIVRLAFKPTPSISKEQDSVDLDKGESAKLVIEGRHDPCVVVRAVPVVEAALAIGLLDCMMEDR